MRFLLLAPLLLAAGFSFGQPLPPRSVASPALGPAPVTPPPPAVRVPARGLDAAGDPGFSVDTSSREAVRQLHRSVYGASEGVAMEWTGNAALCQPGATAATYQEAIEWRINYYRALAGVPGDVVLDADRNPAQQSTALIMGVNHFIGHDLPDDLQCYTPEADEAAGESNLAIGSAGPEAIDGYMLDPGAGNAAVGHRRWLLLPQNRVMATGDVPEQGDLWAANALFVLGDHIWDPRPPTRDDFVAWPPPGYVPYAVTPLRWSLSYPDADFSAATVTVVHGGGSLPVQLEPLAPNRGENTLVWYFTDKDPEDLRARWPRPAADTTYDVTVAGAQVDGQPRTFHYQVTVFDPEVPGPDTVLPELSGPDTAPVGSATPYTYTPLANIPAFEWLEARSRLITEVEGADTDLGPFVPRISPGYDPRAQKPKFQFSKCFLLTHSEPTDQYLTHEDRLLPGPQAKLKFETRLSNATDSQVAQVQVSLDDGSSWRTVWSKAGDPDDYLGDLWFDPVEVSLAPYAGRLLRLRFVYHYVSGGLYIPWDPNLTWHNGIGFYIEDVAFEDVRALTGEAFHQVLAPTPIAFTPDATGDYVLATRGLLFGQFPLEWGPAKSVTAVPGLGWTVTFTGAQVVGGQFQADVELNPAQASPQITVEHAAAPEGPWQVDPEASVMVVEPGARYRVLRSADDGAGFLRVRVQ